MNKKQLIEALEPFPDDMEIWVNDNGYCEGGLPLKGIVPMLAYLASLDGDEITDEYFFMNDEPTTQLDLDKYKYIDNPPVLSKTILLTQS